MALLRASKSAPALGSTLNLADDRTFARNIFTYPCLDKFACAVEVLVDEFGPIPGPILDLWDERLIPLKSNGRILNVKHAMRALSDRLDLRAPDIILTLMLLETAMRSDHAILKPYSVIPLLVSCVTIALKFQLDAIVNIGDIFDAIEDLLDNLDFENFKYMERELLVLIDWKVPTCPKNYRNYATLLYTL